MSEDSFDRGYLKGRSDEREDLRAWLKDQRSAFKTRANYDQMYSDEDNGRIAIIDKLLALLEEEAGK